MSDMKPFWMVYRDGSNYISKKHETKDDALSEAQRIDGDHFDPYQDMNVIVKNSQIDIKWKIGLKWKIGYRIRHPKSIAHVYGFPLEG